MVPPICSNSFCLHPRQRTQAAVRKMVHGLCNTCYQKQRAAKPQQQPARTQSLSQLLDQCLSNNGIITIPASTAGRPHRLLVLPAADTPSSVASERTLYRRSSVIKTCIDAVSTKRKHVDQQEEDIAYQLAHCLKSPRTASVEGQWDDMVTYAISTHVLQKEQVALSNDERAIVGTAA